MKNRIKKKVSDSPAKVIKELLVVALLSFGALVYLFILIEFALNWPSWVSDLSLALIAGSLAGVMSGLMILLFDKYAVENRYQTVAYEGIVAVINQSALFICDLSVWQRRQRKSAAQRGLQACLTAKDSDAVINFCVQQINTLRDVKITAQKIGILRKHIREHLDFLERTLGVYGSIFTYYDCCVYLLVQHSDLHKILLVSENALIPLKSPSEDVEDKQPAMTKILIIEKAYKSYLNNLEQFLKYAQIELKKDSI